MIKRKVSLNDFEGDKNLKSDEGWVRMDVRWMCTEDSVGAQFATFGRTLFGPGGGAHELHTHPNAEEILYVIRGEGIAISGDEEFKIGPGDLVFVPKGDLHFFKNTHATDDLEVVFVYGGAPTLEKAGYEPVKE